MDVHPAETSRIVGVDAARCVALLGMIATHALTTRSADGSLSLAHQIAGGRASALFAVLAGVSLALISGGPQPPRRGERASIAVGVAVRALTIAVIGLLLGELNTTIAVILTYYGVLFLLGLPFLALGRGALAVLAGTWLVVVPMLSHLVRPHLPGRGFDSPRLGSLADPWQLLTELTFTGYYPAVPWLGYLLVGLAIGRSDLRRRSTATFLLLLGTCLAAFSWLGSEVLLRQPEVARVLLETWGQPDLTMGQLRDLLAQGVAGSTSTSSWWWLAVHAPHSGTPFDLTHTAGTAMIVLGACLLLGQRWPRPTAVTLGAGAMTLTLYSLHVVLRTPQFLPEDGTATFAVHVVIVLLIGAAFRLTGRRGPLERSDRPACRARQPDGCAGPLCRCLRPLIPARLKDAHGGDPRHSSAVAS